MIPTAIRIITDHYELGELLNLQELHGGFCNRSFAVVARKNDYRTMYFVRRYKPNTAEKEIKFEHALVGHLKDNGFNLVAGCIVNRNGGTYVNEKQIFGNQVMNGFWSVFEYLEGEDRYTWTDTDISAEDVTSAAKVLARLHAAGHRFRKPAGADRVQPKIMDFLPTFRDVYSEFTQKAGTTQFDRHFRNHCKRILEAVEQALIPAEDSDRMPQLPIHCDYHQGNLKYKDNQVTGVFDFDWSKIDLRVFDLTLALVYFCAVWVGRQAGSLNMNTYNLFLQTYDGACRVADGPGPLTELEKNYLAVMLAAANLYVLHWTIVDFYSLENPDDAEYLKFLNHGIGLMNWIETHRRQFHEFH